MTRYTGYSIIALGILFLSTPLQASNVPVSSSELANAEANNLAPLPRALADPVTQDVMAATPQDAVSVPTETNIDQVAFDEITQSLFPLSAEQIQRLRQAFNQTQLAATNWPGIPPKPVISSTAIDLAPGTTPPAVRLQQGMVSVLSFMDGSGAPWPIELYDIGNPSAFNIQWNKLDNTLLIQPTTVYTAANLVIKLQHLATPIILMLFPGQKVFDSRLDVHVPGLGPNPNPMSTGTGLPNSANPQLLSILDGVAPPNSTALRVLGGEGQAWALENRLFVRTRLTIISPAWIATMSSIDGMHAYEIIKPAEQMPVLLASVNGKIIQLKVEGS